MTSKQMYEALLIELLKENAPNILLEDFNYLANKAINQYINKRYNIYDVNQQTTDDLRVLKATTMLDVTSANRLNEYDDLSTIDGKNATYYVDLPNDYLHMLNCICIYKLKKTYKCYNAGDTWRAAATRLTADAYSQVLDNFWLKPTYKRPYYYLHNINQYTSNPTNPYNGLSNGTDAPAPRVLKKTNEEGETENISVRDSDELVEDWDGIDIIQLRKNSSNVDKEIRNVSNVQRAAGIRYGNVSNVRCEIRYGSDTSVFELIKVYIDYLKAPLHIRLTLRQLDSTEDISLVLEYPDYVCQEIINELVHITMENISDLRLQTHPVVSLSIANPAQPLTPEADRRTA